MRRLGRLFGIISKTMLSYIRQRVFLKFLLATTIPIVVVFGLLYFWMARQQRKMIITQVEKQAVILYKQITLTRQWVADHNYILVAGKTDDKLHGVLEAPFETGPGGQVYTKMTPAMLTRRLSAYAEQESLYAFNLTNMDGLNPANKPDPFETEAIMRFRKGLHEGVSRIESHTGGVQLRYAAPLLINQSCLSCHQEQGFVEGDVGGCISVMIPFENALAAIQKNNRALLGGMGGLTIAVIVSVLWFSGSFFLKPIRDIRKQTRNLMTTADTDPKNPPKDELHEFANVCYFLDEQLKNQHLDLEKRIATATADLSETNTKLMEANKALEALNASKSEFLSDISHELRTPLTAIKGAVDILQRKGDHGQEPYLDIIHKNSTFLIRTIVDFLDYAKIEAGRLELEKTRLSLTDLATEVIGAYQGMAEKKAVTINLTGEPQTEVIADSHRIYQVIANLLANAIRFSPQEGAITMAITQVDKKVQMAVSDQGPGIPLDQQALIFDKFYQIHQQKDQGKTGRRASSGIGLAICKGVVLAHGGTIRVQNRTDGGSSFIFTLPGPQINKKFRQIS